MLPFPTNKLCVEYIPDLITLLFKWLAFCDLLKHWLSFLAFSLSTSIWCKYGCVMEWNETSLWILFFSGIKIYHVLCHILLHFQIVSNIEYKPYVLSHSNSLTCLSYLWVWMIAFNVYFNKNNSLLRSCFRFWRP